MKALSLRQPWAFLVSMGYKPIEFRWWSSDFRGGIYIHASKKFDDWGYEWLLKHPELPGVDQVRRNVWCPESDKDFGALIGKTTIVDCIPVEQARLFYPDEMWLTVCQRTLGSHAFILKDSFKLVNPIPCKGKIAPHFFEPDIPMVKNDDSK